MRPLTPDDLLPLDEYRARRAEFAEAHERYVEAYRRVRIGQSATLIFENRQTLWFRAQELLRVMRVEDAEWVKAELDLINALLPAKGELRASLILAEPRDSIDVKLCECSGRIASGRPETGDAHWVEFALTASDRRRLADTGLPAWCALGEETSDALSEEMRQSLLDDLDG